jgi:hypothetical protein
MRQTSCVGYIVTGDHRRRGSWWFLSLFITFLALTKLLSLALE